MTTTERNPMSVFASYRDEMFERINLRLRFQDRLVGGNPKDPKLVQGWLRKNMGLTDEVELFERTRAHLVEMGVEVGADATYEDLVKASESIAEEIKTQGFKRDEDGNPYIEGRQVKAGIKESVNILYAKQKWGPTGKGPQGFTAERVFIEPDHIPVGNGDAVKIDLAIGHTTGPKGPQSTIGYYEYVEQAEISFSILQLRAQNTTKQEPALDIDQWSRVWAHLELNGLGAMRSQGYGQFIVVEFEIEEGEAVRKIRAV